MAPDFELELEHLVHYDATRLRFGEGLEVGLGLKIDQKPIQTSSLNAM